MLLNLTKAFCLNAVLANLKIKNHRSLTSLAAFGTLLRPASRLEAPVQSVVATQVRAINVSGFTQNQSTNNPTSTVSSEGSTSSSSPELIVEHLNEGIVEIQLNRIQGKNSLSKKLLFEVIGD